MESLVSTLKNIVGSDYVSDDLNVRFTYSRDASPEPSRMPDVVVRPHSTEEISEIMKLANKTLSTVIVRGAGANLVGLPPGSGGITIDMTSMCDIVELEEKLASVTVQCGMSWSKLTTELRKNGWRTIFWGPFSGGSATVGGAISNSSAGFGSAKHGTVGEALLGLEVILPTGEIINTGSKVNPYAKRFCRYGLGPDTTGLFVGDQGVFGVKCEATLKLEPIPEATELVSYSFPSIESCVEAIYEISKRRLLSNILFLEPTFREILGGFKSLQNRDYTIHGDLEGPSSKVVSAQKEVLEGIVKKLGGEEIANEFARFYFSRPWEFQPRTGPQGQEWVTACYKLPILDYPAHRNLWFNIMNRHKEEMEKHKVSFRLMNLVVENALDPMAVIYWFDEDPDARKVAGNLWREMIDEEIKIGSVHYWLGKVIGERVAKAYPAPYMNLLRRLKKELDPNRILEPGILLL
jgi:FAD/FMN-containing dehydrogenase